MDNHCVMCGAYLADTGRMVCPECEKPKKENKKRLIDANAVLGNYWKRVLRGETPTVEDLLYAIEHAPTERGVENGNL